MSNIFNYLSQLPKELRTALEGEVSVSGDSAAVATHAPSHQSGGGDAIKLDDLAAPDDNTDLNSTTSKHGLLPKLGGGTANFLRADGTWASPDGGVPASHKTSHQAGGGDAIKLDDLAAPDDNTDLNATISAHGLLPKLDNSAVHFLNGQGGYTTPDHGSIGGLADDDHTQYTLVDGTRGFTLGAIKTGSGTVDAPFTIWNGAGLTATFPSLTAAANGRRYSITNIHDTFLTVAAGAGDSLHAFAFSLVATGETLTYIFLDDVWYLLGVPRFDPRRELEFYEEFIANVNTGQTGWTATVNGAGAAVNSNTAGGNGDAAHPGTFQLTTGTTTTGDATLTRGNNNGAGFVLGGGRLFVEWDINIPTLSTAGEEYIIRIGGGDTAAADQVDGVYFIYDRLTSTNWIMGTANNSTRTATASSTAVGTGWSRLKIIINAAGTSAEYLVNGVSIGTVSTNLPSGAARVLGFVAGIKKSAGTTARAFDVDYCYARQLFTTAR